MSLKKLVCVVLIIWAFQCKMYVAKENVFCEIIRETRFSWTYKRIADNSTWLVNNDAQIVKCNFDKKSGFTYNLIGKKLSDIYNFLEIGTDFVINKKSVMFQSAINRTTEGPIYRLSEIIFENGELQLLPSGFDMIFRRVNSLNITNCELAILDKTNLEQFGKHLKVANFSNNLLTFLTADLFQYNYKICSCDFSENPLLHIPSNPYFSPVFSKIHKKLGISFTFHNITCTDFSKSRTVSLYISGPVNCVNPASYINYNDLVYNMKRSAEETEMTCITDSSCMKSKTDEVDDKKNLNENIEHFKLKTYDCRINVLDTRVTVKKRATITTEATEQEIKKCVSKTQNKNVKNYLTFTRSDKVEYIPAKIVDAVNFKINAISIVNKGLCSLNEYDMMQFGGDILVAVFSFNKIRIISKNIFRHNKNLNEIILNGNPIKYIEPEFKMRSSDNIVDVSRLKGRSDSQL